MTTISAAWFTLTHQALLRQRIPLDASMMEEIGAAKEFLGITRGVAISEVAV